MAAAAKNNRALCNAFSVDPPRLTDLSAPLWSQSFEIKKNTYPYECLVRHGMLLAFIGVGMTV
jgi:hypothetical protein